MSIPQNDLPGDPADHSGSEHPPRRWVKRLKRGGVAVGILIVVLGSGLAVGEYYMGKPAFCGSCHIMGPYYKSWSKDLHGRELGTRCVDCHYAPGERFTIKAKFKGLSQLVSYFSGRAGQARPRAHVSDASCLTAPCHGDNAFVDKELVIGEPRIEKRVVGSQTVEVSRQPTVKFVHQVHLSPKSALSDTRRRLEEVRGVLKAAAPAQVFSRLERLSVSVDSAAQREAAVKTVLSKAGLAKVEPNALELVRLEHLKTRQKQLVGITCAACHFYDPTGNTHLIVDRETCYSCHFMSQAFNRDTGTCLTCHEAPQRMIAVHEPSASQPAGTTMMDHQEVVRRNIDCASCHLDVIRGESPVTERECAHCHDQRSYLTAFASRTTEQVEDYHRVHVTAQRARCPDCHQPIQHGMIEPTYVASRSGFIDTVLANCDHCHPNHHHEQVELLMGVGGEGVASPMPNAMFGSRINCQACHTQAGSDFKGDALVKATADTCVACHGEDYRALLDQWIHEISSHLQEADDVFQRLNKRLESLRARGQKVPEEVNVLARQASANLHLVRAGNGIHNKNSAFNLLDVARASVRRAEDLLPPP